MSATGKRIITTALITTLAIGGTLITSHGAAHAKDGPGPSGGTDAAALAHAQKVAPLNAVANALGEQGRGKYDNTYGNLRVNENSGSVTLYVTNAEQGLKLIAAAKAAHPGIDTTLIKVVICEHTKKALDAQVAKIMEITAASTAADLTVYSASVNPDASGITVTGNRDKLDGIRRKIAADAAASVAPVTVTAGAVVKAASWRWNDTAPFIGGDVLLGASRQNGYRSLCTAGLATEDSTGSDYLITADHCFAGGYVYGEGDAVGTFGFNYGNKIGVVYGGNDHWDAQIIDTRAYNGAGTNSDEADTPAGKWYAVTDYSYSYNGQSVCQDGAASYYTGHGVPCGIVVTNQDITYNLTWEDGTVHSVRGVLGHNSSWAGKSGDSGALVFTVTNSTDRQARGIVSAMVGNTDLYWTEAPDILNAFGMLLNPHT